MNPAKTSISHLLAILLVLLAGSCGGTRVETPEPAPIARFSVELGAAQSALVSSLSVCITALRFTLTGGGSAVNVNVSIDAVGVGPSGTALTTVSIPQGSYQMVEADLTSLCASGKSVQLTNTTGTFDATSSMTLSFPGTLVADSSLRTLTLNAQPFLDALTSVNSNATADADIKNAAASTTGSVTPSPTGSIVFEQTGYGNDTSPSNKISVVNFPSSTKPGALMVCAVTSSVGALSVAGISDSQGNGYLRAMGPVAGGGALANSRLEVWYAPIKGASNMRVDAYLSDFLSGDKSISCFEYSGAVFSNPLDQTAVVSGNGLTPTSPSVATTSANELIFTACLAASQTPSNGPGFTLRSTANNHDAYEDRIIHSTGSYGATCSGLSSTQDWIAAILTIRAN